MLSAKDEAIQNLLSEKKVWMWFFIVHSAALVILNLVYLNVPSNDYLQALHFELGSLAIVLQKVHETFTNMNEEVRDLLILSNTGSGILEYKMYKCGSVMSAKGD